MVVWLMIIVSLVVVVALLTLIFGKALGRGEVMPPLVDNLSLQELNREAIAAQRYDSITFDTVVRGYRQDQVDAVIAQLEAEIARLRSGEATATDS